jgi:hypothetical protein
MLDNVQGYKKMWVLNGKKPDFGPVHQRDEEAHEGSPGKSYLTSNLSQSHSCLYMTHPHFTAKREKWPEVTMLRMDSCLE